MFKVFYEKYNRYKIINVDNIELGFIVFTYVQRLWLTTLKLACDLL